MSGPRWLYVPTGPEILPVPISSTAAASRVRPRSSSNAQPASLSPSVVGSAWTEWVRPIITVLGLGAGAGDDHGEQAVAVERAAARRPRGAGARARVDDVAAGQPEVEVAALGPDRLGDLADERDDVVVGRPLDLGDPRRRRRARAISSAASASGGTWPRADWARATASSTRSIASKRADVRPDRAHLGERVARDHRASGRRPTPAPAPMSWRRWRPGEVDGVGGALGDGPGGLEVRRRGRRRSGPGRRPSGPCRRRRGGAGVEDERARSPGVVEAVDRRRRVGRVG